MISEWYVNLEAERERGKGMREHGNVPRLSQEREKQLNEKDRKKEKGTQRE